MDPDPDIFGLASDCLQLFAGLNNELDASPTELIPLTAIQNEAGRFSVWCGNLGALQQSFASLDYRLRESPVMLSNVCRLLQKLQSNLAESKSSYPVPPCKGCECYQTFCLVSGACAAQRFPLFPSTLANMV